MYIKPSEGLGEQFQELAALARESNEPVFITKDGEADTVLLSMKYFEEHIRYLPYRSVMPQEVEMDDKTQDNVKEGESISMGTEHELGKELRRMYDNAPRGSQATFIHLFAIRFAKEIKDNRLNKKQILLFAGLPESYQTEISKGVNLAKYVSINPDVKF